MPDQTYSRGSEWRRWDLEVHTPFSTLNNGFDGDFDTYAKTLLERAVAAGIAVIGVTDYFLIEGYTRLRELLADRGKLDALLGVEIAERARHILLLPNIELRTTVIVTCPGGQASRVNFHVLFSDEFAPSFIEEHFLRDLKFTSVASAGNPDERWSLTRANLEGLGRALKEQHEPFRDRSDLRVGMENAAVAHEDVTKVLETQATRFADLFILGVPADEDLAKCNWDGQGHLARKLLLQKAHVLFSTNANTREFALGLKHATVDEFRKEFGNLKPCVHGSDAHSYDALFRCAGEQYLWIKADPTFNGLRQILHEPQSRVFLGECPPSVSRVRLNSTKYMDEVRFDRTTTAREDEQWFSGSVPLNPGLVAIIGRKGSGKSALADVLGLLGDSRASEHFSFLSRERFLSPKTRLGSMFRACVTWRSGLEVTRELDKPVRSGSQERVKYIPQSYLEEICAEIAESSSSQFDRELMEVIYSHVGEAERLHAETLQELIDYLTNEHEERVSQIAAELTDVNAAIVSLEDQDTKEYRESLELQLAQRRAELAAHQAVEPAVVAKPDEDPEGQEAARAVNNALAALQEEATDLDNRLATEQQRSREAAGRLAASGKLLARLENLERQISTFYTESSADGKALGVDVSGLVVLRVERQPILEARAAAEAEGKAAHEALDAEVDGSLAARRRAVAGEIETKRRQLDAPSLRYQLYLQELGTWKKRHDEIQGSAEAASSVEGLNAKLASLDDIPARLSERKAERERLVRDIYEAKGKLLAAYRGLYAPVQQFIDRHPASQQQGALQFFASITVDGFVDGLLEMIHQGRKGTFQGDSEGRDRLREAVSGADFSTADGVIAFLESILDQLWHDRRDDGDKPAQLREQLRQRATPEGVYDFLSGLSYLKPRYELRWQGKPLDQLSPGERGNLLLVFYLLIDKRDVPLVIDQPEENLDNQTIATMLVPAIRDAKARRQIVIVTHNPNLAVVCDADQIIHARLDKTQGNKVVYEAGAIESPNVTKMIVDVLEGTKPAFDLRDAKYEVLERHP